MVPSTSSSKTSERESDGLDTAGIADLRGLAIRSDAALNALLLRNSRRLIMTVARPRDRSAIYGKRFASQAGFPGIDNSILRLSKVRKEYNPGGVFVFECRRRIGAAKLETFQKLLRVLYTPFVIRIFFQHAS